MNSMKSIKYPSDSLPSLTGVEIDVPDGWLVEAAPEVAFVAADPTELEGMHVNVVVAIRRIPADMDIDRIGEVVAAEAAALEGCSISQAEPVNLGDRVARLRTITLSDPSNSAHASLCQLQLLCVAKLNENVADAVAVTLSYPEGVSEAKLKEYRELLLTARVGK